MATNLFKIGQLHHASNFIRNLPRAQIIGSATAPKTFELVDGRIIRNLSLSSGPLRKRKGFDPEKADPAKDRRVLIPYETSIRYLKSKAFKEAYGDQPVWFWYRRNFVGQKPPEKTRRTCISKGFLYSGNPCPICRDEYLVLHYKNTELLKQFISPISGEILPTSKTGLCLQKYDELLIEIHKAKDFGTITFDLPFRRYNYDDYIPEGLEFR